MRIGSRHRINGSLAVADPLSLETSCLAVSLNGCMRFNAEMRLLVVVEHYCPLQGFPLPSSLVTVLGFVEDAQSLLDGIVVDST